MSEGYRFLEKGRHLSPHMEYILAHRRLEEINQKKILSTNVLFFSPNTFISETQEISISDLLFLINLVLISLVVYKQT